MDFPWLDAFTAPQRDRPLLLNDGQRFTGSQTVRMHYADAAPSSLPPPVQLKAAVGTFTILWKKIDGRTVERVARAEFQQPLIGANEYSAVRQSLRQWSAAALW